MSLTQGERMLAEHAAQTARPLFQFYGWVWRDLGIPTLDQMVMSILDLMRLAKKQEPGDQAAASGRFHVECDESGMTVSLILGSWDYDDED